MSPWSSRREGRTGESGSTSQPERPVRASSPERGDSSLLSNFGDRFLESCRGNVPAMARSRGSGLVRNARVGVEEAIRSGRDGGPKALNPGQRLVDDRERGYRARPSPDPAAGDPDRGRQFLPLPPAHHAQDGDFQPEIPRRPRLRFGRVCIVDLGAESRFRAMPILFSGSAVRRGINRSTSRA